MLDVTDQNYSYRFNSYTVTYRFSGFWRNGLLAISLLIGGSTASATTTFVSTFDDPGNVGTVGGGGLLGSSGSDVPIGSGPWKGTYNGILGLVAPPTLTISNSGGFGGTGSGEIADLAGVGAVGGIVNNSGWFFIDTGVAWAPTTSYRLSVDVYTGGVISNAAVLSAAGVGAALTDAADNPVISSTDPTALLSLQILTGDWYRLSLDYTSGGSVPGSNIGIRLFDAPTDLLTADLLATVRFSNVTLEEVPEPGYTALLAILLVVLAAMRERAGARSSATLVPGPSPSVSRRMGHLLQNRSRFSLSK